MTKKKLPQPPKLTDEDKVAALAKELVTNGQAKDEVDAKQRMDLEM